MSKNLTCNQVMALINFYVEGKLNSVLKEYVESHISQCPNCAQKVSDLKKILFKYTEKNNKEEKQMKDFFVNLSAYVDNELNAGENIKIRKIAISNPQARKELESMYNFQKLLHSAYSKTKNEHKIDYAKEIINEIYDREIYSTSYFSKIMFLFFIIITAIIIGFYFLYF